MFNYHALLVRCTPGQARTKVTRLMQQPTSAVTGLPFHPRQGGSEAPTGRCPRQGRGLGRRGGDATAGVLQQRSGVTWHSQTCTHTHTGGGAHARISDVRQRKVEGGRRGRTLHTDRRQILWHFVLLGVSWTAGSFVALQNRVSWGNLFLVCALSVLLLRVSVDTKPLWKEERGAHSDVTGSILLKRQIKREKGRGLKGMKR